MYFFFSNGKRITIESSLAIYRAMNKTVAEIIIYRY